MIKASQQNSLFTIQDISRKSDIPKSTLRFWEKEFEGILMPLRTNGGQRRYSQEHLSVIEKIKNMRTKGFSLSEIKGQLTNNHELEPKKNKMGNFDDLAERIAEAVKRELYCYFLDT